MRGSIIQPHFAGRLDEGDADGLLEIAALAREFQRDHPCPSTGLPSGPCPGYWKDHIIPLACGGPDAVSNMQWQTTAEATAQDAWERWARAKSGYRRSVPVTTRPIEGRFFRCIGNVNVKEFYFTGDASRLHLPEDSAGPASPAQSTISEGGMSVGRPTMPDNVSWWRVPCATGSIQRRYRLSSLVTNGNNCCPSASPGPTAVQLAEKLGNRSAVGP